MRSVFLSSDISGSLKKLLFAKLQQRALETTASPFASAEICCLLLRATVLFTKVWRPKTTDISIVLK